MTAKQRKAFQHSYSRHGEELGLPNWSEKNAATLQKQFNDVAGHIRDNGQLTKGRYVLDKPAMAPHTKGSLAEGKSQFFYNVNADELALDAAVYADLAGLWVENKAKVVMDDFIGVHARTGLPTQVVNIYRTATNLVHATPGTPL